MISETSSTSPVWLTLLMQATACLAAGLIVSYLLRLRPARAHQVLVVAMLACVIAPGLYLAVRSAGLGVFTAGGSPAGLQPESTEIQVQAEPWVAEATVAETGDYLVNPDPVAAARAVPVSVTAWLQVPVVLAWAWLAASAALSLHLVLRFVLGLRLVAGAAVVREGRLRTAVRLSKGKLAIAGRVRVLTSDRVRSPIIWCWANRPILLVQRDLVHDLARLDWAAVFCHELAHWKRRDHLTGLASELLCALAPWHPLTWWTRRRLLCLSEQACDDWVLASGRLGVDYAESLLSLSPERQRAFLPAGVGKEKTMKMRIHRIVADQCGNPKVGTRWALAVSVLAALIIVAVAVAQPGPTEAMGPEPAAGRAVLEVGPRPEPRGRPDALDPAVAGRRNVLSRLRDQLQLQIAETEASLRDDPDRESVRSQVLRSELATLRGQMQGVERQLSQPGQGQGRNRPEGMRREGPMPQAQERRVAELRQRRQELTQKIERTKGRLMDLDDAQGQEARELRKQIDQINAQLRGVDQQMADIGRSQAGLQRDNVPGMSGRQGSEEGMRQTRSAEPGRLRQREAEIRARLGNLEDENGEEARDLRQELDRLRVRRESMERGLQGSEPIEGRIQGQRPEGEGRRQPAGGETVTDVYKLQHADAGQMQKIIASLLSPAGKVNSDERTGSLIITDLPESHKRIQGVIKELDVQGSAGRRGAGTEVDELRSQVKALKAQIQKMQTALDQMAGQKGKEKPQPQQQEMKEY